MSEKKIVGILPNNYVHVLDLTTNITTLEVGPANLMLRDNQKLVAGPHPFVKVPPGYYCIVKNPIDPTKPLQDGKLFEPRFGHQEVRLHGEPFPLYPGESLEGGTLADYKGAVRQLPVLRACHGLHLRALVDIEADGEMRRCGDEWQLKGPVTYIPNPDVEIVRNMSPQVIAGGNALRLKARQELVDKDGAPRFTGEEWLVRDVGAYLPGVMEEVVGMVDAYTMTSQVALHILATDNFTDQFGVKRHIGDEWLVTSEQCESYIPDITEDMKRVVNLTVLKSHQYAVVLDPVGQDNKNTLGCRELRVGPTTFFLHPGERLETGIKNSMILQADEAVVVTAHDEFVDTLPNGKTVQRGPGDKWMIHGPTEFIPKTEIGKFERRKTIPLNENEGVYVRDIQSGQVRCVHGPQAYMIQANEELYEKELTPLVEDLLRHGGGIGDASIRKLSYFDGSVDPKYQSRDRTRVITYRCPSNTAVQVYNYLKKTARVVFGPDLVILGPHETFNVLFLSAGKPKKQGALISICIMLGPDFISDTIVVETSDHARLKVAISMNNVFRFEKGNAESEAQLFSVPDFIGFACREVASKIRASVASLPFEQFHKYSNDIIRAGVFGKSEEGELKEELIFNANNLVITNIDVQSIEPVDQHMRDSLMKSVQMAIEISTNSIERFAQHEAKRTEQKARGELERQKLNNEKEAEEARHLLLKLQAVASAVESSGQAKAEAQAHAQRLLIEGQSAIELAELRAEAARVENEAELSCQSQAREAEVSFIREQNQLEIAKAKELSDIEVGKFSKMVSAVSKQTIARIAMAGPEAKLKMLQALGIQNVLITDGKSPVNLFQSPQGITQMPGHY
ncbi:major vault protein-like [Halichondria panicea]|uniref:major vault protein-like n=1 Tax=Halichondria panicea TaxID=6063 RepID=UPI00312B6869